LALDPLYDEKALLTKAATGDRKSFAELYSGYLNNVYQFIFPFTKSREETEEIIQDVFVKIWERKEKLAEVDSFKSYLFKAAKNKLISEVRHLQIRHRVMSEVKRNSEVSNETSNSGIDYKAYYQVVQKAIEKLPPKRKLIFRLSTENGLSHDEIANQLKVSKSFVKNQLYMAYDFVRQYLSKHGEFFLLMLILLLEFMK